MEINERLIIETLEEMGKKEAAACEARVPEIFLYADDPNAFPDHERIELEKHLSNCNRCRYVFNEARKGFVETALDRVLTSAQTDDMKIRIKQWMVNLQQQTKLALQAAVDTTQKTVHLLHDGLEMLRLADTPMVFGTVHSRGNIGKVRGAVRIKNKGKENGSAPVETRKTPNVQVQIDQSGSSIQISSEMLKKPWPLVMLVPQEEGEPVIRQFSQADNKEILLAVFEDLKPGEYFIFIEAVQK